MLIDFVMTTIHCPTVASSAVVKGSDADAVCEGNTGLCSVSSYFLHMFFYLTFLASKVSQSNSV